MNTVVMSTNSFILGIIGGLLDYASASLLLLNQGQGGMGAMDSNVASAEAWALLLVLLGSAVIVTAIFSVQSIGIRLGRLFSILMIVYGVTMFIIGLSMSIGYIPSSGISVVYSYGMVLVGGAMVVNGAMMSRTPMPI